MTEMTIKLRAWERDALRKQARRCGQHPRDLASQYVRAALGLTITKRDNAGGTVSTPSTGIVTVNR
ncbi:MAG: hypothetical protein R2867_19765 [Caldilineaceae bacterium]